MKLHATAAVALSIALGCASYTPDASRQDAQLDSGDVPQLFNLGSVPLRDGATGLLVSYVTKNPLDSIALQAEARSVLLWFLPELERRGFSHILVVAMPNIPSPGRIEGRAWHACVTRSGGISWLDDLAGFSNLCAPFVVPLERLVSP